MILVYINSNHGIGKSAMEVVTYGKKMGDVVAVTAGNVDESSLAVLGQYGASKVMLDKSCAADDPQQISKLVAAAAESVGAKTIIFSHDLIAKAVATRLSVRLKAGLIPGAIEVPGANKDGDKRCALPITKVTAIVSPSALPRPSITPPMTPALV